MHALPSSTYTGDIHCVTTWSQAREWCSRGSRSTRCSPRCRPWADATHALALSSTGYTTNLCLADVTGGRAWVAFTADGMPLPPDHGGPARLLVPHLLFLEERQWVSGLRILDHDEPGFWERRGYHDRGDPWLEQREQGD